MISKFTMSASQTSAASRMPLTIFWKTCWLLVIFGIQQAYGQLLDTEFQPTVTAMCKPGYMNIRVTFNHSFVGAIHAKDHRKPHCMVAGDGSNNATLSINLLAARDAPDYCGVTVNSLTEERNLSIAVRIHKTLELADDKFYQITCGKSRFRNAKNETSLVSLRVLDGGHRVQDAYFGHNYTLRADVSPVDGTSGIRVKSCVAFNKENATVLLIDDRGCPVKNQIISKFMYEPATGTAVANLYSMFRFSDHPQQVHFQCAIVVCRETCGPLICDGDDDPGVKNGLVLAKGQNFEESPLYFAGTSVFVLDPGQEAKNSPVCSDGSVHPPWLLWLAIALGVLFIIMLIINIFLCSAMTCSCAQTEIIEKEPSIIEDYDPYRSWHGSQYGSRYSLSGRPDYTSGGSTMKSTRYSLNGKPEYPSGVTTIKSTRYSPNEKPDYTSGGSTMKSTRYSLNGKPGYTSGGSTMNSTRSISTNSDHYAIVHSRPGSRYSGPGHKHHHHHRGPSSNLGSHYSAK